MSLLLVELHPTDPERDAVHRFVDRVAQTVAELGGTLIETQVTADGAAAFVVVEHDDASELRETLHGAGIRTDGVDPVRLVGDDLERVRASRPAGQYLVEWDLPAGLTMEAYLARKKAKAPKYADVPEATFLRTYVREDMAKCLCFYDAEDEGAVLKARAAVEAPIDRLHHLERH